MKCKLSLLFFISLSIFPLFAQQQFADLGDFSLESGEVIYDCRIGFRVFGKLNEDKSNVVIYPSWFGGNSEALKQVVGEGKFIDTTKYFVIAIDPLANGISTSPSNSEKQPLDKFPQISIRDMINAQYRMLKENFKFEKIYGAIGGSMGGMQVLELLIAYPGFIEKIVAYVPSPRLSTNDLLVMNFQKYIIETGKKFNIPEKEYMKGIHILTALAARSPDYIIETISRDSFPGYFAAFEREPNKIFTPDNYLVQLKAMLNHNIAKKYNDSLEEAAKSVKAKVLIIVGEKDQLVHKAPAIEFAGMINAELVVLDNNCGHLAPGCELERTSKLIDDFFNE